MIIRKVNAKKERSDSPKVEKTLFALYLLSLLPEDETFAYYSFPFLKYFPYPPRSKRFLLKIFGAWQRDGGDRYNKPFVLYTQMTKYITYTICKLEKKGE